MDFKCTDCCAIQEITNLSSHESGEDAMEDFCRQTIGKGYVKFVTRKEEDVLYSFYLFTAAVEHDGSDNWAGPYGKNFYTYIKEHNLGECWESPVVPNRAFHKDHSNQVYIWIPDHEALKAWYKPRIQVYEEEVNEILANGTLGVPKSGKCAKCHTKLYSHVALIAPNKKALCVNCFDLDKCRVHGGVVLDGSVVSGWRCTGFGVDGGHSCNNKIEKGKKCLFEVDSKGYLPGKVACHECLEKLNGKAA